MADYKLEFITKTEIELSEKLDHESRITAVDTVTRVLDDYEVTKKNADLIPYEDVNGALLKRYCACLLIEGKSQKTVSQYKRTIEKFSDVVRKNYNEIMVYDIRLFLACEKQRGVSNRTLENTRAYLSAFFQWLSREELIFKNPCLSVKPIKFVDKVKLPFSSVDIDSLRSACNSLKERAIIEVLLSSGMRVSELTALKVSDVNFSNRSIHITNGKGAKERTVYINELALTHLQAYLLNRNIDGSFLFYNYKREQLNVGGVRHILNVIGERANVDNVHPHRFRRTFATGLASRGMNIQDIQHLLGHTSINTTMEYIYMNDDNVRASYLKFIN